MVYAKKTSFKNKAFFVCEILLKNLLDGIIIYSSVSCCLVLATPTDWVVMAHVPILQEVALWEGFVQEGTNPPVGNIEAWKEKNSNHVICYSKMIQHFAIMQDGCLGEPRIL